MLLGEPLLQSVLAASVHLPKYWMGLPFATAAGCYALALICSHLIKPEV